MRKTALSRRDQVARYLRCLADWCTATAIALLLSSCERTPASLYQEPETWTSVPNHFDNLSVLSENIERDELILYMRTISRELGVRCSHCHQTRNEDYASDDLEAKIIARDMMQLVGEFNELVNQRPDAATVTCYMCHRGTAKPPAAMGLPPNPEV